MKHPAVLSVDLGSAYTKLSVRRSWNDSATLVRDPRAPRDSNYCIPSILTRVTARGRTEWLIGTAADSQSPGPNVFRVRYWKAALFAPMQSAGQSIEETARKRAAATEYAIRFFAGLRHLIGDRRELSALPVRVCVPKLNNSVGVEALVRGILEESGWKAVSDRAAIFEPESNALGLLTRGRNATWIPTVQDFRPRPVRSIAMQKMFEPGLANSFRRLAADFGVLVTDIGAFTTDFGFVRFDTSFRDDEWARPEIVQASVRLGIRELDSAVFRLLSPDVQACVRTLTGMEWEAHKRSLYSGNPVMLRRPSGGTLKIGDGAEKDDILAVVRDFALRVVRERVKFCDQLGSARIAEEILSGGGVLIPTLREALKKKSSAQSLCDLLNPDEPDEAVRRGVGLLSERDKDRRRVENRELLRGGSAMGGASVFFD